MCRSSGTLNSHYDYCHVCILHCYRQMQHNCVLSDISAVIICICSIAEYLGDGYTDGVKFCMMVDMGPGHFEDSP